MSVMFSEIHKELGATLIEKRVEGITFDEILYADDTICIGTDTRSLNLFLKTIERKAKQYGLKLNTGKCEMITNQINPNVHFADGTKLRIVEEAKYLGCNLNDTSNYKKEIGKRISNTIVTMKRLNIFWLHSNCPVKFKLIAADAVIRTKLLYGMESAQLGEAELKRINTVQLKIFRHILGLKTTYVERENTNAKLWKDINTKVTAEGKKKQITSFEQAYAKAKRQTMPKILSDRRDLKHTAIFNDDLQERVYANRRAGRPKATWAETALAEFWEGVRNTQQEWRHTKLDVTNPDIRRQLKKSAKDMIENP